jgi:hypothetical protein
MDLGSGHEKVHVNPPAEEGPLFPRNSLVGVIGDIDELEQAVNELNQQGIADDEITVLQGPGGIETIDMKGKRHGLLGRVFRALDRLGDEHDETVTHVEALRNGRMVLVVHVEGDEARDRALQIFRRHHGEHVSYYTRWTTEHLIR